VNRARQDLRVSRENKVQQDLRVSKGREYQPLLLW
jgi:hypothetical protein